MKEWMKGSVSSFRIFYYKFLNIRWETENIKPKSLNFFLNILGLFFGFFFHTKIQTLKLHHWNEMHLKTKLFIYTPNLLSTVKVFWFTWKSSESIWPRCLAVISHCHSLPLVVKLIQQVLISFNSEFWKLLHYSLWPGS